MVGMKAFSVAVAKLQTGRPFFYYLLLLLNNGNINGLTVIAVQSYGRSSISASIDLADYTRKRFSINNVDF